MRSWRSNTQHTSRSMLLGVTLIILAGPYSAEEVSSGSIAASLSSSSQKHVASPPGSEHPLHPGDISPVSSEWARFNENGCFYKIVSRPMLGWAAARESCARFANGADLASITDESELRFLANVAQGSNSSSGKAIPSPWWVGGFSSGPPKVPPPCPKPAMALMVSRCIVVLDNIMWRWSDGSFFDQKRMWGPGEPSAGSEGYCTLQGYDAVGMKKLHTLNDEHCIVRRQYACKWCEELPAHVEPPVLPVPQTACAEVKLRDVHGDNPWDGEGTVELQWLSCQKGSITSVLFASVGRPYGQCTSKVQSALTANPYCHANARAIVEKECLGKESCGPKVSKALLGEPCAGQNLRFVARVRCGKPTGAEERHAHAAQLKELVQGPGGLNAAEQIKSLVTHIVGANAASVGAQLSSSAKKAEELPWGHDVVNVVMPLKLCQGKKSSVGGPACSCRSSCSLCRNHKHRRLQTCFRCSNDKVLDGRWGSKYSACIAECPESRPIKYGTVDTGFFCGSNPASGNIVDPEPALCLSTGKTIGGTPCKCADRRCEVCTVSSQHGSICYRCSVGFDLGIPGAVCKRDTTQLGVKRSGGGEQRL